MRRRLERGDLVYPELCYQIIGALFSVWNKVGSGHKEGFYQKAVARELQIAQLSFREQLPAALRYGGSVIGEYRFDFLIVDKVILELKVRNYFSVADIRQRYSYLRAKKLQLGIIAHFTKTGVKYKRVVNIV